MTRQRQSKGRLLVVDDDKNLRESIARGLTGLGFDVELAESGKTALERASPRSCDLMLLDQMMPGLTGLDVLRLLRATYSQTELPVIMLTGMGEDEFLAEALDCGANDYVAKPVNLNVTSARIKSQLDRCRTAKAEKYTDALTGLGNRLHLIETLTAWIQNENQTPAIVFLDLDGFKIINDGFGRAAGDCVLLETARRIAAVVDQLGVSSNNVATVRLSSDEFVVALRNTPPQGLEFAQMILSQLGRPILFGDIQLVVTASAGVSVAPIEGALVEDIIRDADLAMYHAKQSGKNRACVFEPSMRYNAHSRVALTAELRGAIERGELRAAYQPQVDLTTRTLLGFECLLRWHHIDHGWVPPSEMIPLAEESGLIIPIGLWILDNACQQLRIWQDRFPREKPLTVSVNLSVKQLADPGLVSDVERIVADSGIAPGSLHLELTESSVMSNLEQSLEIMSRLQALKVGLELDDFGTGYSSFSYLRSIRFDSLKLDQSFVRDIGKGSADSRVIVTKIIDMAHELNMAVIAEGIETVEQLAQLTESRCDIGQGYLLSKPLEASAAGELLRQARVW